MAAGDLVGNPVISADGWYVDVTLEGLGTGGTFAERLGLGLNYDPDSGAPKAMFTVTSKSKTAAEADTTIERIVWGTKRIRWPSTTRSVAGSYTSGTFQEGETVTQDVTGATGVVAYPGASGPKLYFYDPTGTPDDTNNWVGGTSGATFAPSATPVQEGTDSAPGDRVFFDGTNTVIRLSLSSYIYAKDQSGSGNSGVDVTFDFLGGIYSQGGTDSAAATGTATNSSTAAYQEPIYNWTWVPFERITGTFKLRAAAFERHGQQAKPVRAVIFSATDGTHTVTQTVESPSIDAAMSADRAPAVEYVASLDPSTLDQGADITCNFKVVPWVGDAVFDSSTGTAQPTPLVGPITLLCDRTGAYGADTYAVVDPVNGSDPAGVTLADDAGKAVGTGDPTLGGGTDYLTPARAFRAIRNYNANAYGRDDVGGGIVYVKAGSFAWLGATISGGYGSTPKTWATLKPYPGVARADVILTGVSGNTDVSDRVKIEGVKITTTTNSTFAGITHRWFHDCEWDSASGAPVATTGLWYVTHSKLTRFDQGLRPSGTQNCPCALARGNEFAGADCTVLVYTAVGNEQTSKYNCVEARFVNRINGSLAPASRPILAYNKIRGWQVSAGSVCINFGGVDESLSGAAIVQNLFECTVNASGGIGLIFASVLTDGRFTDNVLVWYNAFVGQRMQFGYNASGTGVNHRRFWSVKGNYWDIVGCKTDTFGTPSGRRQGNHPLVWGVDCSGNVSGNVDEIAAAGFDFEVLGLSSIDTGTANDPDYPLFTDRQSYDGTEGPGLGDYNTEEGSPLRGLGIDLLLPYDLQGRTRTSENNDAGAYAHELPLTVDLGFVASEESVAGLTVTTNISLGSVASEEAVHGLALSQNVGLGQIASEEAIHGLTVEPGEENTDPGAAIEVYFRRSDLEVEFVRRS